MLSVVFKNIEELNVLTYLVCLVLLNFVEVNYWTSLMPSGTLMEVLKYLNH